MHFNMLKWFLQAKDTKNINLRKLFSTLSINVASWSIGNVENYK